MFRSICLLLVCLFAASALLADGQPGKAKTSRSTPEKGWVAFAPKEDLSQPSPLDLRWLNEKEAGMHGPLAAKGARFVRGDSEPIRFWAVNGPSGKGREELTKEARFLARYGVNMVRVHRGYYDENGNLDKAKVQEALEVVAAMKAEGIYTLFSIYFPLWLKPSEKTAWAKGYDGKKHPFATLFFNDEFQTQYRDWWKALLTTPSQRTGKKLIDDPAVAALEIINEDSYFFWTFNEGAIPDAQLRILEGRFAKWLETKYGSAEKAFAAWKSPRLKRDNLAEGRVGFRPLWNVANERTQRDQDTARFLVESQRGFYESTRKYLRDLGFKGLITASNWHTADPRVLGPLEKYSYTAGDFIDRHGYFGCLHKGDNSAWSVRDGHTYHDRSALRFDPEEPGKPRLFAHPVMDPTYNNLPSMISETTFNRPNRYRSEAPIYFAAYGALQDTDAIVHFALDGTRWTVKPRFFMQPWTLCSPAMLGQFPATALLYRQGLIKAGESLVELNLSLDKLLSLEGTPLPQEAALDELRLKDVTSKTPQAGGVIDPLVHYAGRTSVAFSKEGGPAKLADTKKLIDRTRQTVQSSTGELNLDYGKGFLTLNAPGVQGVSGNLQAAGTVALSDVTIESKLSLGHVLVVSLDGLPLARARKILVQVMSEEKATGFRTEPLRDGRHKIQSIGTDPWLFRAMEGTIRFKGGQVKVTPLDHAGYPRADARATDQIDLAPDVLYYRVAR